MKKYLFLSAISASILMFSGCATTTMQTQSKMTRSIFVEPVKKDQRIVFVDIKNTSGQNVNLAPLVEQELTKKGYKLTDDPETAKYVLMANILFCDNKKENNAAGGAAFGAATGALSQAYRGDREAVAGALAGGVIGGLVAKATEDDIFQMVVDINVREKAKHAVKISQNSSMGQASISDERRAGFMNSFAGPIANADGSGKLNDAITDGKQQSYESDYIEKQTRIMAEAIKMGLKLEEAIPELEKKVAAQIAGIF